MSRRLAILAAGFLAFFLTAQQPALAQQINSQPVRPATDPDDPQDQRDQREERELGIAERDVGPPPPVEDCSESESSSISGEIIVCRRQRDQSEFRTRSADRAETEYARATMLKDAPRAPNPNGPNSGIFTGPATVAGLCFVPPCPTPTMPDIDFAELPEAPAGSDADRIGRGLPPIGYDGEESGAEQARQIQADALSGAGEPEQVEQTHPQADGESQAGTLDN